MSLRSKWEFEYTASKLAETAKAQHDFRAERVTFWENEQAKLIKQIKESGIEVHEDITQLASNSLKYSNSSAMGGAQIVIDPTMQSDLNKCYHKIKEHGDMKKHYAAWIQVLEGNPDSRVKLDHDDWMFFFGK